MRALIGNRHVRFWRCRLPAIVLAGFALGCSSASRWDGGVPRSGDANADADVEGAEDDAWVPLPFLAVCGNGNIDEGEECDDRNRLDGDGCDWQCRVGDGSAVDPFAPGSTAYDHENSGSSLSTRAAVSLPIYRLPLVWTGTVYATAFFEDREVTRETNAVRVHRFRPDGTSVGEDWRYEVPTVVDSLALLWREEEYALFFLDAGTGIRMQRLDADGRPLSEALVVVDDSMALAPAAAFAPNGYVVTWVQRASEVDHVRWCTGGAGDPPVQRVRARVIGPHGETEGLPGPVTLEDRAGGPPDVVAGGDGYGFLIAVDGSTEHPDCALRFVRTTSDLDVTMSSGILSSSPGGDIAKMGGHFYALWSHQGDAVDGDSEICAARFDLRGELTVAPTCARFPAVSALQAPRIAATDGHLGVIYGATDHRLLFTTASFDCRYTLPPLELVTSPVGWIGGAYAIAAGDGAFGVIFQQDPHSAFTLRTLVPR